MDWTQLISETNKDYGKKAFSLTPCNQLIIAHATDGFDVDPDYN